MTALFVKQHSESISKALESMEQFFIDETSYDRFSSTVVNGICEIATLLLHASEDKRHEVILDSRELSDFLFQVKHLTQYMRDLGIFFEKHKDCIINLES